VAMLVIPAVAARFWTERLGRMLGVAGLVGGLSGYAGGAASSLVDDVPTGPIVVLSAGVLLVISLLFAPRRGVIAAALGRARLRLRIAGDHLLELAHDLGTRTLDRAELRRVATVRGWPVWLRPLVVLALRRRGSVRRVGISRLELTEAGLRRGAEIARNHALWTQYLVSYADVAPSHVDWTVDQVEHVLAEEIVAELEARMRDKERAA
ncbi:MAG: metal ABC transporter permease, partial [Planctomycetota bacterium]